VGTVKRISLLGIHPVHPGRGEPSRIELTVILDYLKGGQAAKVVLTPGQALKLAEDAVRAARSVGEID
jgi:hypothetical protein